MRAVSSDVRRIEERPISSRKPDERMSRIDWDASSARNEMTVVAQFGKARLVNRRKQTTKMMPIAQNDATVAVAIRSRDSSTSENTDSPATAWNTSPGKFIDDFPA